MQSDRKAVRENWGSRLGFVLAAAGSAIGLGNVWRFPYVLGENGGFAFLLVYLCCVVLIGLPIMGAEMVIGRGSRRNPFGAFKALLPGSAWWLVGAIGIVTGVIILSYYNVVAGWTLAYLFRSLTGLVSGFTGPDSAELAYESFVSDSAQVVIYLFLFAVLGILVVAQGVKGGIERWAKILMPTLFLLLLLLIGRSLTLEGSGDGLAFLFAPDFSKINGDVILMAMGQAFYSLSLGMGVMITYGSYLDNRTNIFSSAGTVAGLDALIAVLAGVAIFPAVFAMGMEPSSGFGLTYQVLPMVFAKLPLSDVLSSLFFLLLTIAALTSAISLLEVMVSFATDELHWTRARATIIMAAFAFVVGVPSALSFGVWSDVTVFGLGFFGVADYITANVLLPLGGIGIAVFAGWAWGRGVKQEILLGSNQETLYYVWLWSVRILAPIAVALILIFNFV
ncbi:MAG: hypothetical protein MAG453_01158 [Calditrichaeota bacterium]|nr:hypothetical protein [Calditrichota bacterium]